METSGRTELPPAAEMASVEEEEGEVDPNLWVVTDTVAYMEKQQSQGQDGAVSSLLPSPQQPAQPVKKRRKVPWASYKPDGFGSFFDTTAEINHKMCVILDLFPNDLDQRKVAFDVAIDPDEHLRCRRSNREVIRRRFDDYTEHLSDYDSFVDDGDESEEGEGAESEDEDYGTIKWSRKRKLADTTAPEDLPFQCPHCPRRFTRELYLKGHLVRHSNFKPYQCPHCKKAFGREHHLKSHMTHSHPAGTSAAAVSEGGEGEGREMVVFKCTLCGEGYSRIAQLTAHIQANHAEDVSPPAPPTDIPPGEGTATEGIYSSSSSDEEAALLIREDDDDAMGNTGGGEGEGKPQTSPVFHCPHCPRTFTREMYLTSHLDSHSEDRPHKCLICGKGFSRVHHLKSHMTHRHPQLGDTSTTLTGTSSSTSVEPAFKCPCCRRSFRKDFHLKSHIYQKHRDDKDAFEFLKQFTSKKRRRSSDLGVDLSPVSMETEDKSPHNSKPIVHSSAARPVSSEGSHFVFDKAQNVTNGPLQDPHGAVPSGNGQLHNLEPIATDLSPVFGESTMSGGKCSDVAVSQPRAREDGDERPYKCPECGQGFARRSFLGSHIYQKHKRRRASSTDNEHSSQPAIPGTAPKPLLPVGEGPSAIVRKDSTLVVPRVKEVNGRSRRVSSSTTILSDTSDEDRSHVRSPPEALNAVFKCPHCHRRFTRKAHLVSHVVAHSDERPYKCPHCEKAYGTGYHLKSHITYCHRSVVDTHPAAADRVFPFRCGECNESFPEHSMLRKHFSESHSISETKETKSEAGPHVPIGSTGSTATTLVSLPTGGSDGPSPFPPPPPNKLGMIGESAAIPHSEDGTSEVMIDGEGVTTVVASGQIAPVESAASPSSTIGDKPDGGAKEKSIKCPHCPRTFSYSGHLSSHLVSHSSDRPFSCDHCSKSFAQKHHLKSHITHRHMKKRDVATPLDAASTTNPKGSEPPSLSFSCTECGKAFMQKNHLASHVYHKHPHARKSSSSSSSREGRASSHMHEASSREGKATGQVGGASSRVGGASGRVGGGATVQMDGTVIRVGVSPVREGGAPSPGLKSPNELLGFMQSMASRNHLADLDLGRNLRESPFMRGSPSVWEDSQEDPSTREAVASQEGSRENPSTRKNLAISKGLSGREGDPHAVVKGSSSSKRNKLPVALGYHTSRDVIESPQPAHLPGGTAAAVLPSALQSTVTPPTNNMADPRTTISTAHSLLPQHPVTFIGGIPIVQTSFPASMGRVQQNSPLITGSSPGFYMLPTPQVSVAGRSLQQLSTQVPWERGVTSLAGEGDVLAGTAQPRPSPSHPTATAPPSLPCTHCPRLFQHQAHLDAHQAAHRTSSTAGIRSRSSLLAPLSHDCHMDSSPMGGATPPLSTGYYMSPGLPVTVADDQSASVGHPTPQKRASTGSSPRLSSSRLEPKEEGTFRCPYCPLSFDMKSHLASHLVSHENSTSSAPAEKPYQCPHCSKSCDTSRQLNTHMKKAHQTATVQVVEKERLFKCDQCGKSFHQEHHLGVHVYLKHLSDEVLGITEEGGAFPCVHCGHVFEYKHLLKSHMFHNHKGVELRQPAGQSDSLANSTAVVDSAA